MAMYSQGCSAGVAADHCGGGSAGVRTTRCALGAHRCGTTCAPPVHQACASGAGTPCIPTVYKGPEHMCSQGCSQAAQKGHLFNVSTVGGPK